jgi:hypothetical protein
LRTGLCEGFGVRWKERTMARTRLFVTGAAIAGAVSAAACTPTVQIQAPDKPITINLNVKIDQEVRVRLDKEIEDLIKQNPDAF